MSIFKAYDIRGLCPDELDEPLAHAIGRGFGTLLGRGPVAVAHDMRPTSPGLASCMVRGLTECGLDVVSLGLASTPMLNFAVASRGLAGGAMITASHNPGRYNGIKLCREQGIPLAGDSGIAELERWVKTTHADFERAARPGTVTVADPFPAYRDLFLRLVHPGARPLHVVVDCGNGIAGPFEYEILRALFERTQGLFVEPDGTFPHHDANPLVEKNLDDLRQAVVSSGADAGFAFDGDGDRVVFVDETGRTVSGDLLLALMVPPMLKASPGAAVLYDLRSSWAVREEIERAGGKPILSRVGHSFIKRTLREHDGVLGGEVSGHYYFRDFYYLDSGIYAALKVLEMMSHADRPLSALIQPLDRYPRTGEVNFVVDDADRTLARVESAYATQGRHTKLDGLSVEFADWWFNLRKSNTEPLVRLNAEAKTRERLTEAVAALRQLIGGHEH